MARVRKISRRPNKTEKNYFLVDACFLADKYLPISSAPGASDQTQLREAKRWWKEIDHQTSAGLARVYIPDLCVAEAFKVLAKKYYREGAFAHAAGYKKAREKLSRDITIEHKVLKAKKRHIKYHDLPTTRDIVIAVDRFHELFMKYGLNVGVIDLILVACAKYLMDFHDARRSQIHIITTDHALWKGTKKVAELPNAYDPTQPSDAFARVFV